jgi:3-oxoacyl-[acyl-carrier protein] reductase
MFGLAGKRALVTGATGGIGGGIAKMLAAAGASVALSGTRQEVLDALAKELGDGTAVVPCDLTDGDAVGGLVGAAEEKLGGLDVLVNNAGITRDNLALRLKDEDWETVLQVNLAAAFRLARAALRGMMRQRWGRIINITSIVGVTGNPGQTNYAAAKAGMIGMSKSLAQEVASRGITVNCVAPGFIESPMTDALSEERRGALLMQVPIGRLGRAEDVAACVNFLASDEAEYITGQTLHVNGGMAMI